MSKARAITQTFFTNGVWISPENYQGPVFLQGCAGGQGGQGSHDNTPSGGGASPMFEFMLSVEPSTQHIVLIGSGGIGSSGSGPLLGEPTRFGHVEFPASAGSAINFFGYVDGSYAGGKAGPFGNGADGGVDNANGKDAIANSGAGGGGGSLTSETDGGAGGSGRLSVTWWV